MQPHTEEPAQNKPQAPCLCCEAAHPAPGVPKKPFRKNRAFKPLIILQ